MDERDVVRDLVAKLMEAVEASLDGSPAVREALDELARAGFDPRLIVHVAPAVAKAIRSPLPSAGNARPRASTSELSQIGPTISTVCSGHDSAGCAIGITVW